MSDRACAIRAVCEVYALKIVIRYNVIREGRLYRRFTDGALPRGTRCRQYLYSWALLRMRTMTHVNLSHRGMAVRLGSHARHVGQAIRWIRR